MKKSGNRYTLSRSDRSQQGKRISIDTGDTELRVQTKKCHVCRKRDFILKEKMKTDASLAKKNVCNVEIEKKMKYSN